MKNRVFNPPKAGGHKLGRMPKDARFNPFDGTPMLELRGIGGASRRESQLEAFRRRKVDKEKLASEIALDWTGEKKNLGILFASVGIQPNQDREYIIGKSVEEVRKIAGDKAAAIFIKVITLTLRGMTGLLNADYKPVDELDAGYPDEMGMANLPPPELLGRVLERGGREKLLAQGVEIWKGGLSTMINIMLEGEIRKGQIGSLKNGNSDSASGSHGPYYVVVDVGFDWQNVKCDASGRNCRITEDAHVAYIVPLEKHKAHVTNTIAKGFRRSLISWHEAVGLISKLVTYQEFVSAPKGIFNSSRAFSEWNKETAKEMLFEAVDAQEREEYAMLVLGK